MQIAIPLLSDKSNISRINVIVSPLLMKNGGGDRGKLAAKEYLTLGE